MAFDDLLRELLAAPDDAARAEVAARLAQVPDALPQIAQRIVSADRGERLLGLHVLSRFVPAPELFHYPLQQCLLHPIGSDALGEERALVLVCASQMPRAFGSDADRERLAAAVAETQRAAQAERADDRTLAVMYRLAQQALDNVDNVRLEDRRRWDGEIELLAGHVTAGRDAEAAALVAAGARAEYDPPAGAGARWEAAGDRLRATSATHARTCYERALDGFRQYASGATSGGEGMSRMLEVHRIEAKLAAL